MLASLELALPIEDEEVLAVATLEVATAQSRLVRVSRTRRSEQLVVVVKLYSLYLRRESLNCWYFEMLRNHFLLDCGGLRQESVPLDQHNHQEDYL